MMAIASPLWLVPALLYVNATVPDPSDPARPSRLGNALYTMYWLLYGGIGAGVWVDDPRLVPRLIGAFVATLGTLVGGALVGVLVTTIDRSASALLHGNTPVVDASHTVVLGWTPDTLPLLRHLAATHKENGSPRSVVVLGDAPKEEMDAALDDLRSSFPRFLLLTRQGSPQAREDLERVAAGDAETVVLMRGGGGGDGRTVVATRWALASIVGRGGTGPRMVVGGSGAVQDAWHEVRGWVGVRRREVQGRIRSSLCLRSIIIKCCFVSLVMSSLPERKHSWAVLL